MKDLKTLNDLRNVLATQLEKIASGEATPASANAFANICGKIISTVRVELSYNKMLGTVPSIDFIRLDKQPKKLEKKKK